MFNFHHIATQFDKTKFKMAVIKLRIFNPLVPGKQNAKICQFIKMSSNKTKNLVSIRPNYGRP